MTKLQEIREGFIEASCPTGADKHQIQDMEQAFDAGAISILNIIIGMPDKTFSSDMDSLLQEARANAKFHMEEGT